MKITSTRRLFLQGTAATGVAATIAGCSQKSASEQASADASANAAAAEAQSKLPSTAWTRADYAAVKDGGTLTIAATQIPTNWNPNQIDGNETTTTAALAPCGYAGENKVDEHGKVTTNPDYIESAEVTKQDPQTITVKFNQKAVWDHDGSQVKVADLIAQWKACNGSNPDFQLVSTTGWESIKDIRAIDDFTAEIEYSTPFPDWIGYIYPSGPAAVYADANAFNTGYTAQPLPGKGPFKIASIDANGGVITLERNPKWWGQAPKLEKIIFKVTTQQTMPQAFANGELDYIDIGDGDTLGQAKGRKDAAIQRSNGLTWTHLTINVNGGNGVLQDVAVRKAIFAAVDRNAVARAVVEKLESPIVLQNNYIYMPGQDGYEDSFGGTVSGASEIAKAKKILEDAGYKLNNKVYEKDGKKLEFTIIIPAETKSNENRAKQVMTNLNQAGFNVSLKPVPSDKYFSDYVLKQAFDFVTFSWVGTVFAESAGTPIFLPDGGQNYTGLKDDKLAEINKRLQSELDPAKRRTIGDEFSKEVASQFINLPFYATPNIVGLKSGLVNIGASQFESVDYTTVGYKA